MKRCLIIICGLLLLVNPPAQAADPMLSMLPVSTPMLTPGKVERKTLKQHVTTPLFIVGDDALSHRWLSEKRDYLARIGAKGMVVNVRTPAGWHRLTQYGLSVYPVSGNDFARAFGLSHYPVLIEGREVKQ